MKRIKDFIDWLFWKRIWFRVIFILFPTWMIPFTWFFHKQGWIKYMGDENYRILIILIYLLFFALAIIDNEKIKHQ